MNMRRLLRISLGSLFLACFVLSSSAKAADDDAKKTEKEIKEAVKALVDKLEKRETNLKGTADKQEAELRDILWRVIVAEECVATGRLNMSAEARRQLKEARDEFEKLKKARKEDKEVEARFEKSSRLIALYVMANQLTDKSGRGGDLEVIAAVSERLRLNRLRELNKTYRKVSADAAAMNAYFLLEDYGKVEECYKRIDGELKSVEKRWSEKESRPDLYLFTDEKRLLDKPVPEEELVPNLEPAFEKGMVSHFGALQVMAAYRMATAKQGNPDSKQLGIAIENAKKLVGDRKRESFLAYYVLASANHDLGLLSVKGKEFDPAARTIAAGYFKAAQDAMAKATGLEKEKAPNTLLGPDLARRSLELKSAGPFLERAGNAVAKGKHAEAVRELEQALLVWPNAEVLARLVDARRRVGEPFAESLELIRRADKMLHITKENSEAWLTLGRLEMLDAWQRFALTKPADLDAAAVADLIKQVESGRQKAADIEQQPDDPLALMARADMALGYGLAAAIDPKRKDAAAEALVGKPLQELASANEVQEKAEKDPARRLALGEAVVSARLAHGLLVLRYQAQKSGIDPLLMMAAAADKQTLLGVSGTKLFGSPMIGALLSGPDGKGLRVAFEERQLRRVVSRLAEGLTAEQRGEKNGAAEAAEAAMKEGELLGDGQIDATDLLSQREDDARSVLRMQARSLAILLLAGGEKAEKAVEQALHLLPGPRLTPTNAADPAVATRLKTMTDPQAVYALGVALEEYAVSLPVGDERAKKMLETATVAQRWAEKLLEQPVARNRYPQLVGLIAAARGRLEKPELALKEAEGLRKALKVPDALKVLEGARKRRPDNLPLRQEQMRARLDDAYLKSGANRRSAIESMLVDAETSLREGAGLSGEIYIKLGQEAMKLEKEGLARKLYLRAVASGNAEEKAIAQLRLVVLDANRDPESFADAR